MTLSLLRTYWPLHGDGKIYSSAEMKEDVLSCSETTKVRPGDAGGQGQPGGAGGVEGGLFPTLRTCHVSMSQLRAAPFQNAGRAVARRPGWPGRPAVPTDQAASLLGAATSDKYNKHGGETNCS